MSENDYRHDWDWVSRALDAERKAERLQNAMIAVGLICFIFGTIVGRVVL